jgi:hypothetical protein
LLASGKAIEAHPEKALVEAGNDGILGARYVFSGDRRFLGRIPGAGSPFLKKIRIALALLEDQLEGLWTNLCTPCLNRVLDGFRGFLGRKSANFLELKKTL